MTHSKHYFKLKGDDAEQFASNLASKCFLEDWCYTNPKLPDGKELCDLLVVYDTVAVIFQIKSLKLGSDGKYKPAKVEKNVRQLYGARRRLLDADRPLELENPRRGVETFDPSSVDQVYLVSVIVGDGEVVSRMFNEQDGILCHMFTGTFLEAALNELDTVSDFLAYMSAKEELHGSVQLNVLGGEEELLAKYLLAGRSFEKFKGYTSVLIDEGLWDELHSRSEYVAKEKENEISYAWDGMIGRAHEAGSAEYERIARELARPNRFGRRVLSKAFLEAQLAATEDREKDMLRRTIAVDGITYCFLYMDDRDLQNENRRAYLVAMCHVARKLILSNQLVIGVATEKTFGATCSYDFARIEILDWTDEHEEVARHFQANYGLFTNTKPVRFSEEEYPNQE